MKLVHKLKHCVALSLVVSLGLWLAGCAKETTAPVKPVTNGAPKKLPQAGSTAGPGAEVPEQSETSKEPAAKSDDKPAEEKPAEEKKSDEKPADDKPVEEKKSDDKPAEEKPSEEKKSE
jgi:hypothetical protein